MLILAAKLSEGTRPIMDPLITVHFLFTCCWLWWVVTCRNNRVDLQLWYISNYIFCWFRLAYLSIIFSRPASMDSTRTVDADHWKRIDKLWIQSVSYSFQSSQKKYLRLPGPSALLLPVTHDYRLWEVEVAAR